MKIWSLLPSATEILFALGLDDEMTGVTHECDYPPEARQQAARDDQLHRFVAEQPRNRRQVTQHFREGRKLYGLDEARLRDDPPDLIVTQDLCPVCAVSPSDFAGHMEAAGCRAEVVTLNPNRLEDILDTLGGR